VFITRCSGSNIKKAAAVCFAAAFICLLGAGRADAASRYGQYWQVTQDGQSVRFAKDFESLNSTAAAATVYVTVYYDWDFDGQWLTQFVHSDDAGLPDYDRSNTFSVVGTVANFIVPLDPRYQVYFVTVGASDGVDDFRTWSVIVNSRAEVVLANDEPTPVRIQEIGPSSTATTLAPDVLPVSVDASISLDGTPSVSVSSFLGETDGNVVWAILGSLCGVASILALDRLIGRSTRDH